MIDAILNITNIRMHAFKFLRDHVHVLCVLKI